MTGSALDATFEQARLVADAVLYEGYLLYPYRASAGKNQLRWQFGVVAPRPFALSDGSEDWVSQTECVVDPDPDTDTRIDVRVRCLRVQERRVEAAADPDGSAFDPVSSLEVDGALFTSFDEATEEEIDVSAAVLSDLLAAPHEWAFELPSSRHEEMLRAADGHLVGRIVRRRQPVSGMVRLSAEMAAGLAPLARLRIRVENVTAWSEPGACRDDVVRRSMVAVHTLVAVRGGAFVSLIDPPECARAAVAECENLHTFPVLIGDPDRHDVLLSSPVTLYDYAEVAPESVGDFYDSTEIDEMLALRVMTLTDEEKREARGTDARAAAIIDRCDILPTEVFERLHGAVRHLRGASPSAHDLLDAEVDPFEDRVWVGDAHVGRGSTVILRPAQRADAHDMFLAGRAAHVHAVLQDVDGNTQLAVTVDDDPASEMHQWYGRYLYFAPGEVEPTGAAVT